MCDSIQFIVVTVKAGQVGGPRSSGGAGKVIQAWPVSFCNSAKSGPHARGGEYVSQCCVEPTFTSDALFALVSMTASVYE